MDEIEPPDENDETPAPDAALTADYQTLQHGFLSPRHRRLAQLAAEGRSNADIAKELGYCDSRVSILLRNKFIAEEIHRLQDRIFEGTIKDRLKGMGDQALSNIQMILHDRSGRVKISEKMAVSQWLVEKLDGKATQPHDVGENLLSVLMDRLDAQKTQPRLVDSAPEDIEVTGTPRIEAPKTAEKQKEDELAAWVRDFVGGSDAD